MPDRTLPDHLKRFYNVDTVDELWFKLLTKGNVRIRRYRPIYSRLPSNPRCANCHRPFAGIGGALLRVLQDVRRSDKNPRYCAACHSFTSQFPGGAEVELTMLFVDVRGSTTIAEKMDAAEFSRLMNRFYEAAINVLVRADAFIDKLVGDEVTALFIPGYTGEEHARKAVQAGRSLLQATGHGDHVNVTARLASNAGSGEVLVSDAAYAAADLDLGQLERRQLALKGKSETTGVRVIRVLLQLS